MKNSAVFCWTRNRNFSEIGIFCLKILTKNIIFSFRFLHPHFINDFGPGGPGGLVDSGHPGGPVDPGDQGDPGGPGGLGGPGGQGGQDYQPR